MTVIAKNARLDKPNGSHHLGTEGRSAYGPFSKEELYPVVVLELPRVGEVSVQFSADRYVSSSGWTEWRIYARRFDPSSGIGDAGHRAAHEAGVPLIREWLNGPDYPAARQQAAAHAAQRLFYDAGSRGYALETLGEQLAAMRDELSFDDLDRFEKALALLKQAAALLDPS